MTNKKKAKSKIDVEIEILEMQRKLLRYEGADKIVSSHEKFAEVKKEQEMDTAAYRMRSDISKLDEMTGGFRLGTLNIVSGPTGEGKTTWMQTLTSNFAIQTIPAVWFSFEVMPAEFFEKFGNTLPLFYLPRSIPENSSVDWITLRIIEAQAKYKTKAVFIDHLHYLSEMQGLATQDKTSFLIGDIMRRLKRVSIMLEVGIFLVAHVKSDSGNYQQIKKYYTKDDIRDSSFVKQEADTVMMIWRKRRENKENDVGWEYTENAMLGLDKNRQAGKIGFVKLEHINHKFYGEGTRNGITIIQGEETRIEGHEEKNAQGEIGF